MKCPRCDIEAEEGRCPQCGLAMNRALEEPSAGPALQAPLQFSVCSKSEQPPATADWRGELRRKLQKYARKKAIELPRNSTGVVNEEQERRAAPARRPESPPKKEGRPKQAEEPTVQDDKRVSAPTEQGLERPLFRYRLEDVEKEPRRRIVTFDKSKQRRSPLDKPLIRKPIKSSPSAKAAGQPEQKTLTLEVVASAVPEPPPAADDSGGEKPPSAESQVSGEILFSRVLGAIIDLLIAGAAGFLFSLIAARLLGSDFPSRQSLILAAATGLLFLFLDSVFFLYTLGATPGMAATDLKLVQEDGREVSLRTAVVGTLLSFLVTITVVGLVWALFDPLRRCWHDRLSGTVVAPGSSDISRADAEAKP